MHDCNCYVRYLDDETRFCLHYGAHEETCPVYRPSLDPVDRAHDEEFRATALARRRGDGPDTAKQFSEEVDTCEECQIAGYTLNEYGIITNPGKFEGEPLAAYHAYHVMMNGFADDDDGPAWRVGNVICEESDQGFVHAEIYDTEEQAIEAWDASADS